MARSQGPARVEVQSRGKIGFLMLNFPCELRITVRYVYMLVFNTANSAGLYGLRLLLVCHLLIGPNQGYQSMVPERLCPRQ